MNIQKHILPKKYKFKIKKPKKKQTTTRHLVVTGVGLGAVILLAGSLKNKQKPTDSEVKGLYDVFLRGLLLM